MLPMPWVTLGVPLAMLFVKVTTMAEVAIHAAGAAFDSRFATERQIDIKVARRTMSLPRNGRGDLQRVTRIRSGRLNRNRDWCSGL